MKAKSRLFWAAVVIVVVTAGLAEWIYIHHTIMQGKIRRARSEFGGDVVHIVGEAACGFVEENCRPPRSVTELLETDWLELDSQDGHRRLTTPRETSTPVARLGVLKLDLDDIVLVLPDSTEGLKLVNGELRSENSEPARLPRIKLKGVEMLDSGHAPRMKKRFAENWYNAMRNCETEDGGHQ